MNNDIWYVLTQHWDEDCCDYSEVDFFTSAKDAVDYAAKLSNDFRSSYEADHFDPDIHAASFLDVRGQDGVPNTLQELLDDANFIKKELLKLSERLNQLKE